MTSNHHARPRRLLHHSLELSTRILRRPRTIDATQHAARRADLDEFRPATDLLPRTFDGFVDAIGEAEGHAAVVVDSAVQGL